MSSSSLFGPPLRRVLVTGSRHHTDRRLIWDALDEARGADDQILVVHGGQTGADSIADMWAVTRRQPVASFPAQWVRHGSRAGPIRNRQMLKEERPDLVLAFPLPDSVGTWDMVEAAESGGVEVRRFHVGEETGGRLPMTDSDADAPNRWHAHLDCGCWEELHAKPSRGQLVECSSRHGVRGVASMFELDPGGDAP